MLECTTPNYELRSMSSQNRRIERQVLTFCRCRTGLTFEDLQSSTSSDPRTWELAAPTIDASSSLCLPHSTNLWQLSEEAVMSWWGVWWGPPAPTFWDHWHRPGSSPGAASRVTPERHTGRTARRCLSRWALP